MNLENLHLFKIYFGRARATANGNKKDKVEKKQKKEVNKFTSLLFHRKII